MPMFRPKNPLRLYKEDNNTPNKDSAFIDGLVREQINMGGVTVYAWLMEGTFGDITTEDETSVQDDQGEIEATPENGMFMSIPDVVLGEIRDRQYSSDAVHLVGSYTVSQNVLSFAMFGSILENDVIQMEFHAKDMERQCGRRLIPGDVVEMPHLKEVAVNGKIKYRFYEVKSLVRAASSYDHSYNYHTVAVTMRPIQDAQEFIDLMEREDDYGNSLGDSISDGAIKDQITEEIQRLAARDARITWWDTTPMYIDPDTTRPYKWTESETPPNGIPVTQATSFPGSPTDGEYVLRVDFNPAALYRYQDGKWIFKSDDIKREWVPYNWVARLRKHSTDRSTSDNARPWQYRSVHDVITDREERSIPSPRDDIE